jgi:hypothetical protein
MAVTFPSLRPTNRTVSQGTYAVKMFKFITGLTAARRYGTSPHSATLDLEYSNITDANASLLTAAFDQAYGTFDSLTLPNALWDDIEEPLRSQLKGTFIWRFAQAPTVNQSAVPGYKSVSIQLEGQRDG